MLKEQEKALNLSQQGIPFRDPEAQKLTTPLALQTCPSSHLPPTYELITVQDHTHGKTLSLADSLQS